MNQDDLDDAKGNSADPPAPAKPDEAPRPVDQKTQKDASEERAKAGGYD